VFLGPGRTHVRIEAPHDRADIAGDRAQVYFAVRQQRLVENFGISRMGGVCYVANGGALDDE
jgi:hypothetical protein